MKNIHINTKKIKDNKSLHQVFKDELGFPDYYGMNWDAWIDCMTHLDDSRIGPFKNDEVLCLEISDTEDFNTRLPDLVKHLIECTSFVNQHYKDYVKKNIQVVLEFL